MATPVLPPAEDALGNLHPVAPNAAPLILSAQDVRQRFGQIEVLRGVSL